MIGTASRLWRRALPLAAAALALGFVPPATAAGSLAWTDPAGDATGVDPLPPPAPGTVGSSPRPQDEGLDLLELTAQSDGQAVTFTARTAIDEIPAGATGATIRFVFSYDGVGYQFIAQRTAPDFSTVISSGVFFRAREPSSPELACRECTVRYDPKAASVTVTALVSSLTSAIRQHAPDSPKFGPGAELTDITVLAQRNAAPLARDVDVGRTITADAAPAEGLVLAV